MGTPPPPAGGNIDVKPSNLHFVAGSFAGQQTPFDKAAKDLLTQLHTYPDAGGYGTAAQNFAKAYVEVGNLYLDVWARSVESIGGAAVGFATTANNYSKAEAANDATGKTKPQIQAPPQVIHKAPDYGSVPDLKWGDDDGGDDFIRSLLEYIPDIVWHVIRPLLKDAFRWGKVADVYPFPQQHYLNSLSQAWADMTIALSTAESMLTGYVNGITQQSNSEWYDAMRHFCSALWGTTAWGKNNPDGSPYQWAHDKASSPTATHPVMSVLFDSGEKISDLLRELAEAAVDLNHKVWNIYFAAVKQAVKSIDFSDGFDMDDVKAGVKTVGRFLGGLLEKGAEVGAEITLNIDTGALNAAVDHYTTRVNALTPKFHALKPYLDEAKLSAPRYHAEEARAEAFGMRALNDFKHDRQWGNKEDADNGIYKVDLASDEWLGGGHTLDKHVGKSDEQLAQRLRDQGDPPTAAWPYGKPKVGAASTFTTTEQAQKLTQYNVDLNSAAIKEWLGRPPQAANDDLKLPLDCTAPNGEDSGRSVTKQPNNVNGEGFKNKGLDAQAIPVKNVRTVLKYDPSLTPPFVVLTSMPTL
ncbi:RNase A-like domain-containing protein [Streptomyces griseofuscus]|uniref:RNase A-like domain-containing protein n=1 Tax=Streptomyces griseofuscus TaxID=146922 RepID=UPI00155A5B3A|nr:RNase A-like domain-containing protein [Streptomyces griseofuscus]